MDLLQLQHLIKYLKKHIKKHHHIERKERNSRQSGKYVENYILQPRMKILKSSHMILIEVSLSTGDF